MKTLKIKTVMTIVLMLTLTGPAGEQGERGWTGARGSTISGEAVLYKTDAAALKEIAAYMKANPSLQLGIDGFTNKVARQWSDDKDLCDNRVKAIRDTLITAGVPANRISEGMFGDVELRRSGRVGVLIKTMHQPVVELINLPDEADLVAPNQAWVKNKEIPSAQRPEASHSPGFWPTGPEMVIDIAPRVWNERRYVWPKNPFYKDDRLEEGFTRLPEPLQRHFQWPKNPFYKDDHLEEGFTRLPEPPQRHFQTPSFIEVVSDKTAQ